ncbi:MAG TPA: glutathione S-transferase family protein [Caulobacteraceae bacterium]
MVGRYVVYGGFRTGSVPVEATLLLLGERYEVIETDPLAQRPSDRRLEAINPMRQVPALVSPSGELMTESAAILNYLADSHPQAHMAPCIGEPARPAFLRWMSFVSSQIYSLYWVRDDLSRLAADTSHEAVIKDRTAERIAECWRRMDAQVNPGRYILGDDLSVLDLYVTVVSRWGPRRSRFYREAPKMAEVVRRVDADPRLTAFWADRFPFEA